MAMEIRKRQGPGPAPRSYAYVLFGLWDSEPTEVLSGAAALAWGLCLLMGGAGFGISHRFHILAHYGPSSIWGSFMAFGGLFQLAAVALEVECLVNRRTERLKTALCWRKWSSLAAMMGWFAVSVATLWAESRDPSGWINATLCISQVVAYLRLPSCTGSLFPMA
jgi:hypothetical protein